MAKVAETATRARLNRAVVLSHFTHLIIRKFKTPKSSLTECSTCVTRHLCRAQTSEGAFVEAAPVLPPSSRDSDHRLCCAAHRSLRWLGGQSLGYSAAERCTRSGASASTNAPSDVCARHRWRVTHVLHSVSDDFGVLNFLIMKCVKCDKTTALLRRVIIDSVYFRTDSILALDMTIQWAQFWCKSTPNFSKRTQLICVRQMGQSGQSEWSQICFDNPPCLPISRRVAGGMDADALVGGIFSWDAIGNVTYWDSFHVTQLWLDWLLICLSDSTLESTHLSQNRIKFK